MCFFFFCKPVFPHRWKVPRLQSGFLDRMTTLFNIYICESTFFILLFILNVATYLVSKWLDWLFSTNENFSMTTPSFQIILHRPKALCQFCSLPAMGFFSTTVILIYLGSHRILTSFSLKSLCFSSFAANSFFNVISCLALRWLPAIR